MLSKFFPEVVKSLFIELDVVDHVVEIRINYFDNLLDVMSTFTAVLDFKLYFFIIALRYFC